ncbi:hypothetical protein ABTZ58_23905 [Streptomyces sp. NPDC094143]|uniref:hypothetical protein n=1 Tax=Streptomyces sp. NPDC094143 TaxID=3155310 RepID=UPI003334A0DB
MPRWTGVLARLRGTDAEGRRSFGRERNRRTGDGAEAPRIVLVVDQADGVRLIRSAYEGPPDTGGTDWRALHGKPGTVTLLFGAVAADSPDLWPFLAEVLDSLATADVTGVRLALAGAGAVRPDRPCVAQLIADTWELEVTAADGTVVVVPDGSLFTPADTSGGSGTWYLFAPGTEPVLLGPRDPAPSWQSAFNRLPRQLDDECAVDGIPAGVLVRPVQEAAPQPGDLSYAVAPDAQRPVVLLGTPRGRAVPADAVAALLVTLPAAVRAGVRLASGSHRDVLPVAQEVADLLSTEVELLTGLPLPGGEDPGTGVHVTLTDDSGTPTWQPVVEAVRCRPAHPDTGRAVPPRPVQPRSPLPGTEPTDRGTVDLSERWRLSLTRAGVALEERDRPPAPPACRPVDPERFVIEASASTDHSDPSFLRACERVLSGLDPALRAHAELRIPAISGDTLQDMRRMAVRHHVALTLVRAPEAPVRPGGPAVTVTTMASGGALQGAVRTGPGRSPDTEDRTSADTGDKTSADAASTRASRVPATGATAPPKRTQPQSRSDGPAGAPLTEDGMAEAAHKDPADGTDLPVAPLPLRASSSGSAAAPSPPAPGVGPSPSPDTATDASGSPAGVGREPAARTTAPDRQPRSGAVPAPPTAARPQGSGPDTNRPASAEPSPPPSPAAPSLPAEPITPASPHTPVTGNTAPVPPTSPRPTPPPAPSPPASPAAPVSPVSTAGSAVPVSAATASTTPLSRTGRPATTASPPVHRSPDAQDRAAFRRFTGSAWDGHAAGVARALTRMPVLRGQDPDVVRTDLVAVRAYLSSPSGPLHHAELARSLRTGDPSRLPYALCLVSGLRRLPTYRGAVVRGGPAPTGVESLLPGTVLHDPAPISGLPLSAAAVPVTAVRYAVWSSTAHRVRALAVAGAGAGGADEVVFPPGSVFRVLQVRPGDTEPMVLLREVPGARSGPEEPAGLNDADRTALTRLSAALDALPAIGGPDHRWPTRCAGPLFGAGAAPT